MSKFEFVGEVRNEHGKAVSRRIRRIEDRIPGVVYGAGKDAMPITLLHKDVFHALEKESVFSSILKLTIGGQDEQVVIKDVQRHPFKPKILHVDFLRVSAKEKITMHVPLHFIGEQDAPGVKNGGVFTKSMIELEIYCLPADLPEFIEIDISKMQLDETIHLFDIKLPAGVELEQQETDEEHNHPVIALHMPRVSKEDIEAEAAEEAAAEEASAESAAEHEEEAEAETAAEPESEASGEEEAKE